MDDIEYQRQIIDTFINAIYVFDDKLVFTYNFKDGTEAIPLKAVDEAFGSDSTQVAPPQFVLKCQFSDFFLIYFSHIRAQKGETKWNSSPIFLLSCVKVRDKSADAQKALSPPANPSPMRA